MVKKIILNTRVLSVHRYKLFWKSKKKNYSSIMQAKYNLAL